MKNKSDYDRILRLADQLRHSVAVWAQQRPTADLAALGAALQPLRYDLDELDSGNYDASRILENTPQ